MKSILIFKRRLFWILIPGLLAGLLATVIVPDSQVPNHIVPNGHSGIIGPTSDAVSREAKIEDSHPNQWFVVLAILVGFVVGMGLALFLELKDGSARSESELARLTGIPVLASIPIIQDHESALKDRREP
jgi:hypothetical protein